jgi:hypothetical protein
MVYSGGVLTPELENVTASAASPAGQSADKIPAVKHGL